MTRAHPVRTALLLAASLGAAAFPLAAQQRSPVHVVEVATDNDAYDFWIPPSVRPDHEYTHGMWLAVEAGAAPLWGRRLGGGRKPCGTAAAAEGESCLSTRFEVGQKLYTPRLDSVAPIPGQRPYAGWLYASATARASSARVRRSLGLEVGVTGPPSLGEEVQVLMHRIGGFWKPVGWRNQLRFEPGAVLRYDESRLLWEGRAGGERVADVTPHWGASAGNVLAGARAGLRVRAGHRLPHPWAGGRGDRRFAAWAVAGVRQDWVAHSLFLDGSTFHDGGVRVTRRPFVLQSDFGAAVRLGAVTAEYLVTVRNREYETQPARHTYSSITLRYERSEKAPR